MHGPAVPCYRAIRFDGTKPIASLGSYASLPYPMASAPSPETLLAKIEQTLAALPLQGAPDELYAPMRYILALGGKRFRPMMTLLGAGLFGGEADKALGGAAAVEVFHNFTLMHDDIMDEAPLRRGKPTVHEKWDEPTAILSGDGMLVKVYEILLNGIDKDLLPEALAAFNRCALEVVEGQQLDMNFERRGNVSEAEYLEMIRLKTAVLAGFALWLGARIAGAPVREAERLRLAGEQMGLGFQLYDDYLDTFGDPALTGKQPGGDIRVSKKTWLLIYTMARLPEGDKAALQSWLENRDPAQADAKVAAVSALMRQAGADAACKALSERYYGGGLAALQPLGVDAGYRQAIEALAAQLMRREF